MKMNKTLAYGLACLYYLGEHNAGQWTRAEKLSEFQRLPTAYCARVLRVLVRAGFVESRKSRGYRLRKDPGDIGAWELMVSFISNFNGAPGIRKNRLPLELHRTLCETMEHRLAGLTVRDIIELTKKETASPAPLV